MKITVAHVTTSPSSLRYLLANQLAALRGDGYEVVAISAAGDDAATITRAGVRHIAVPLTRTLTSPVADLRALAALYRVMRRERFTIVHTHNPKSGVLGQMAAAMAGVPIIVNTVHGFYINDGMSRVARQVVIGMERLAGRYAHLVLSQNREDIDLASRLGICDPAKMRHLGNGIDLTRFTPSPAVRQEAMAVRAALGIPADARVVGFVGRLAARRKGFLDFLEAGRQLRLTPPVHFVIVGEPDSGRPDAVEPEAAAAYGISDRCHFLGKKPNHELPGLYAAMDVVVLPSLFEGLPRALMEAAAMGKPAVATDVKGNREVVVHDETGFLVAYGSPAELAASISRVLEDTSLAQRLGDAALRRAKESFDEKRVFARVLDEYRRLLRERGLTAEPAAALVA